MKLRHSIFIALLAIAPTSILAQRVESGSFEQLADSVGKTINIQLDYTESTIKKYPYELFVELETNWEEGYKELTAKFLAESNDKLNGRLILSAKKQTDLKLVVKVEKVDNDGETYGKLYLYDKNNEVIAISSKIHGEGGRWGTQLNLMGDAIQRVGKQVGSFLLRYVK